MKLEQSLIPAIRKSINRRCIKMTGVSLSTDDEIRSDNSLDIDMEIKFNNKVICMGWINLEVTLKNELVYLEADVATLASSCNLYQNIDVTDLKGLDYFIGPFNIDRFANLKSHPLGWLIKIAKIHKLEWDNTDIRVREKIFDWWQCDY